MLNQTYFNRLKKYFPNILVSYNNTEFFVKVSAKRSVQLISFLRLSSISLCKVLTDMTAIDRVVEKRRFIIAYALTSIRYNARLTILTALAENETHPSITSQYKGANWLEREIWDMMGIIFTNHPDLRRILTDYGFKGHPLRKEFPLTGFIESLYSLTEGGIVYVPVSLPQAYRTWTFNQNFDNTLTN